jgi:hypothetical protein
VKGRKEKEVGIRYQSEAEVATLTTLSSIEEITTITTQ